MRSITLVSASLAVALGIPALALAADAFHYFEEGGAVPTYANHANPPPTPLDKAYEDGGPIRSYESTSMPATAQQTSATQQAAASEYLASNLIGSTVKSQDGRQMGEVQDLVISNGGKVDGVVLAVDNTLGFGSKRVGVDVRDLQPAGNKTLITSITPQQLSSAPDFSQQPALLR